MKTGWETEATLFLAFCNHSSPTPARVEWKLLPITARLVPLFSCEMGFHHTLTYTLWKCFFLKFAWQTSHFVCFYSVVMDCIYFDCSIALFLFPPVFYQQSNALPSKVLIWIHFWTEIFATVVSLWAFDKNTPPHPQRHYGCFHIKEHHQFSVYKILTCHTWQ